MTNPTSRLDRLQNLSPAKRALLLKALREEAVQAEATKAILRRTHTSRPPLSFAQQRLWFLDQLETGSASYNVPTAARLTGPLNLAALEQSLNEILRRHEALRTTFDTIDGVPFQVIAPTLALRLPVIDLQRIPRDQQISEASQLAVNEAQQPFDLATGPLLRATLVRVAPEEHLILLTMHHIVADGWSAGVLIQEIATLYEAFSQGRVSPLPDLPIQYADFACWQREWLQGKVLEDHLAYWKQKLAGAPRALELPTDRPRPVLQTFQGATLPFTFSSALTEQIQALSRRQDVTPFMTLLAAFNTLLFRYSHQVDILVGSPIANRTRPEIQTLIGFFVNVLVLRTNLSGNPTFRELLGRVREGALEAYAQQDLPFEKLVDELQPERDLAHTPLFQVMFVWQNLPTPPLKLSNLLLEILPFESTTSKFDLSLTMTMGDKLEGIFEYNTDLFDEATIVRLVHHFQVLLEGVVSNPNQRLSELPLLTESERHQILTDWNDTQLAYPTERCLHQVFEEQVERTPDSAAVVFEDAHLTYRVLNQRANQLARHLQHLGVGPEVLVGICLERSLEMLVGLLGILKAGGAYVPLAPDYPQERLAFILEETQAPLVLTQTALLERWPAPPTGHLCLDRAGPTLADLSPDQVAHTAGAQNLAYVIYTSGSTGHPKGVAIQHSQAVAFIYWAQQRFASEHVAGVLAATSICFDLSIFELFATWSRGGSVILAQNALHLPHLLAAPRVTLVNTVPSAARELLHSDGLPAAVRVINLAGEPLPQALVEQLYQRPVLEAVNDLYGPSETTTYSTQALRIAGGRATIGRPIGNTQVYLLDAHYQPVPLGATGEIFIGGAGVARGYLHRPELTAECFIPNPFSTELGTRLYRTGDLARYLPDGNLEFLGRSDHQVKVRGFRIELGEIEAALNQHPALQQALVLARAEPNGDKRLVAYVVTADNCQIPASELRHFLQSKLPDYMLPATFVQLDALPLTSNGKLDRRALPAPEWSAAQETYVAPRTWAESTLAEIWSQVLKVRPIGIHDNFFELGGDSIQSIQIIARANRAGLGLVPKHLFHYQTIAELAAIADQGQKVKVEQGFVTGPVPLTPIQHRFFEQDLVDPHRRSQSVWLEVKAALKPAQLEDIVRAVLWHHAALRLRFTRDESGWHQTQAAMSEDTPCTYIDLTQLLHEMCDHAIKVTVTELQTSLDLAVGPLIRVALFDPGRDQSNRLLIIVHQLVVDEFSWRILLEDMQALYERLNAGQPRRLTQTTSFREWAVRLNTYAQSGALESEKGYWLSHLRNENYSLPLDKFGGTNTLSSEREVVVSLDRETTRLLLHEAPQAYHTQLTDILLTALLQAFEGWTGKRYLLLDLEIPGREEELFPEEVILSHTVGWFTTRVPLRLDLTEVSSQPGETLRSVKEQLRQLPQPGLSFGLLRYLSGNARVMEELRSLPQAEVGFHYLEPFHWRSTETALFQLTPKSLELTCSPTEKRAHVLNVDAWVIAEQLEIRLRYSENLHQRSTIEHVAKDYREALLQLITHCTSSETGRYTPSDFPEAGLEQADLDYIMAQLNGEE
ncbi:myxalamid-type nonribosomal peptide synthetase MxaA [Thermoflexales bacterium]|nr:myxalamid-type nonribosomal peptide synthetase MxaA [Thermoflexales bacterium]